MSEIHAPGSRSLVEEVNDNAWILGRVMISRHHSKPSQPCWEDGFGAFFTIAEAPSPKPDTRPASASCPIIDALKTSQLESGLWQIGLAYLGTVLDIGTKEHSTLEALAEKSPDFDVPEVHYHGVHDGVYHVVYSLLLSRSIAEVWPTANDALRTKWTQQIAEAYHDLSKWRGERICGLDGGNLNINLLSKGPWEDSAAYNPNVLRENLEEVGLDCSELVFAHNNTSPLSFMVLDSPGLIGITGWGDAGFVPKDWVRTQTRLNSFGDSLTVVKSTWSESDMADWEAKIDSALAEKGFREYSEKHRNWLNQTRSREV
ncbi:hypothetical protein FHETE_2223 [Fusarium heterosporum]|uniref:Uncharacterized protein n=1 Tax=Fusarium heterosporum TaxID=42747 RepID=A0A8H5WXV3_FUSHE|nr:hypothetical protein FHETE_2223 [Fusarium heterosporum]